MQSNIYNMFSQSQRIYTLPTAKAKELAERYTSPPCVTTITPAAVAYSSPQLKHAPTPSSYHCHDGQRNYFFVSASTAGAAPAFPDNKTGDTQTQKNTSLLRLSTHSLTHSLTPTLLITRTNTLYPKMSRWTKS